MSTLRKINLLQPKNLFNIYNVNRMILQNVKQKSDKKIGLVLQKGHEVSFLIVLTLQLALTTAFSHNPFLVMLIVR